MSKTHNVRGYDDKKITKWYIPTYGKLPSKAYK